MTLFEKLMERLDKRTALASERKWAWITIGIIALLIFCHSAVSLILTAVGMVIKGMASIISAFCEVVAAILGVIVSAIKKISSWIMK